MLTFLNIFSIQPLIPDINSVFHHNLFFKSKDQLDKTENNVKVDVVTIVQKKGSSSSPNF